MEPRITQLNTVEVSFIVIYKGIVYGIVIFCIAVIGERLVNSVQNIINLCYGQNKFSKSGFNYKVNSKFKFAFITYFLILLTPFVGSISKYFELADYYLLYTLFILEVFLI